MRHEIPKKIFMESRYYLEKVNLGFEDSFSIAAQVASECDCPDECFYAAKRALSYNPSNQVVLSLVDSIKPQITKIRDLIEENGTLLQKEKDKFPIWRNLGTFYLALGDFPNSFAAFAHCAPHVAVSAKPVNCPFLYAAGVVYAHFHYPEVAIDFFQKILQSDPQFKLSSDILFRLAILYRTTENFQRSTEMFQSISKPPNNMTEGDIQLQIAYNLSKMGQNDAALKIYQQLYSMNPTNIKLIQQYLIARLLSCNPSQYRELQMETNMIMQNIGFDPVLGLIDARLSMKMNDMKVSYDKCKRCINYSSDSPYFWVSLGILYFSNDQNQDAVSAFQRALFLRSDIPEPWLNIGLIFELNGDNLNAGKIYQTGLQRCPNCKEFQERLQGKRRTSEMLEISDDKFFTQLPEKFANDYISAVPELPLELFPNTFKEEDLKKLSTLPPSVFSEQSTF